jgi:hypothetical protein
MSLPTRLVNTLDEPVAFPSVRTAKSRKRTKHIIEQLSLMSSARVTTLRMLPKLNRGVMIFLTETWQSFRRPAHSPISGECTVSTDKPPEQYLNKLHHRYRQTTKKQHVKIMGESVQMKDYRWKRAIALCPVFVVIGILSNRFAIRAGGYTLTKNSAASCNSRRTWPASVTGACGNHATRG